MTQEKKVRGTRDRIKLGIIKNETADVMEV